MTPLPLRASACGLPLALSVIDTVALRLPVAVGVKVTLMVQFDPAANVFGPRGQVLVCAKSPGLVPARLMLAVVSNSLTVDWMLPLLPAVTWKLHVGSVSLPPAVNCVEPVVASR